MRIHVADWDCLVHDTIHNLLSQLPEDQFIQIHRSIVVRIDFIDRLLHEGNAWFARLQDGERYKVAKSRVQPTLQLMSVVSSKPQALSPNRRKPNDGSSNVIEIRPKIPV